LFVFFFLINIISSKRKELSVTPKFSLLLGNIFKNEKKKMFSKNIFYSINIFI